MGIVGGLLTASAVVLALNGGPPFIKKDATLSIVAPAEISDASRTLDPATSEQLASRAKECSVPLAQVAIWKTPVPRVELLGSALAAISRLSLP